MCIDESEVCDGYNDCPSGADEVATQCIALSSSEEVTQDIFLSPLSSIEGSLRVSCDLDIIHHSRAIMLTTGADLWCLVHVLRTNMGIQGSHSHLQSPRLPGEQPMEQHSSTGGELILL